MPVENSSRIARLIFVVLLTAPFTMLYGCGDSKVAAEGVPPVGQPSHKVPAVGASPADQQNLIGPSNVLDDLKPYYIVTVSGIWPRHTIKVCWESMAPELAKAKGIVRSAVQTHIEKNSAYRFIGWEGCDQTEEARIQIRVADRWPESEVGYQLQEGNLIGPRIELPTRMTLNFSFQLWSADRCGVSQSEKESCIATIAVHEFMHALGAIHEHLSPNLEKENPECWKLYKDVKDVHPTDSKPLTEYDADSIMNYCRDIYTGPTRLSARDLAGLQALSNWTAKKREN